MVVTMYTIGHSTHPIGQFIGLLQTHGIERLVDVRTIPKSRYNPQFQQAVLKAALEKQGIAYEYMKDLGGLRKAQVDSPNAGWHNSSFRGYADYMQTKGFEQALAQLIKAGKEKRTAIMCAESVYWRCHRSLVADALTARDIAVEHIMPDGTLITHKMTAFARVEGETITYPSENMELGL